MKKNNLTNLRVFVINLNDHKDKRLRMKKILSNFSFKYEFFNAFDGRELDIDYFKNYNDCKRKLFLGRSLFPSELGALESNRLILKKITNEKIEKALVLEDDISFNENFEIYLKKIIKLQYNWELIRFNENKKINTAFSRKVIDLDKNVSLRRFPKLYGGSHAYLITLDGAKKILQLTENYYHHIDLIMGQTWKNNLNSLFCIPGLVWQLPELNVVPENHPRFIKKTKKLTNFYPYSRFLYKIYEAIAKWYFFAITFFSDQRNYKKTKINS